MALIKQLDQSTINKIAAGEVIERPCAVVKELVENAIDAKSSAITIEIKDGGISFIRITDNGCGINEDDIETAFLRHATSKITSIEDLFSVTSLGFRGEALSSIAAVAQVELITKETNELMGTRYVIEGGKEVSKDSIGCPEGTTFIVRNIFYNTPVRRKFLKTPSTEASHIGDYVEKLAISHPDIAFKFINNGQIKLNTSGNGKQRDIIYNVYGREITSNSLEVNNHSIDISITGFIGKAVISRGNRNLENYFINGRYIKSSLINKAIEEAYKSYMMVHKYPFTLLNINIDSGEIDVNVHPTKMEIRFMNGAKIYDFIYHTIKDALDNANMIPEVTVSETKMSKSKVTQIKREALPEQFETNRIKKNEELESRKQRDNIVRGRQGVSGKNNIDKGLFNIANKNKDVISSRLELVKETANNLREKISDISTDELLKRKSTVAEVYTRLKEVDNIDKVEEERDKKNNVKDNENANTINNNDSSKIEDNIEYLYKENKETTTVENTIDGNDSVVAEQVSLFDESNDKHIEKKNEIRIVGQVFLTYWIIEFEGKMYIIDQHAAHEKVMYERIMKDLEDNKIISQNVAPPIIVTLNMNEEVYLKENMEVFNSLGFEIENFGGREYSISAIPANLPGKINKDFFLDVLDNLMSGSTTKSDILLEKVASMSCKAAVKGNNKLSYIEMEKLIEELFTLDNPYNCPHGRPTTIAITKDGEKI